MSEPNDMRRPAYANGRCRDCETVRLFHYRGAVVGAQYVPCEKHRLPGASS